MPGNRNDFGRDIITGEIGQQGNGSGPGFSLQVMAELSANLGRVAHSLEEQQARQLAMWRAIRPIPGIPIPQITSANGIADYPELLAPRVGYWWDVKTFTCATFTGGTVNVYLGAGPGNGVTPPDSELALVFTTAGTYQMGTGQLLVSPGQRLVIKAVSVTGNVTPSLTVVEVAAWALPAYLM